MRRFFFSFAIALAVCAMLWPVVTPPAFGQPILFRGFTAAGGGGPVFTFSATAGSTSGCVTISAISGQLIDGISFANSAAQSPLTDNSGASCSGGVSNAYSTIFQSNSACGNGTKACGYYYTQSVSAVGSVVTVNANESQVGVFSRSTGSWALDIGSGVTPTFTNIAVVAGASTGTLGHATELVIGYISLEDGAATFAASGAWTAPAGNCTAGGAGVNCIYYQSVSSTSSVQLTGTITSGSLNFNATTEIHTFF